MFKLDLEKNPESAKWGSQNVCEENITIFDDIFRIQGLQADFIFTNEEKINIEIK